MVETANSKDIDEKLAPALNALGLFSFGWFAFADAPFAGRKGVLIGNRAEHGHHRMWDIFKQSEEYQDTEQNALDRWTKRVVGPLAARHDAVAIYPFGDTLWPFQRFAKAASGMKSSPVGLLIHPQYGLWQAFRAVLIFGENVALEAKGAIGRPCDECEDKPCLLACPVNAYSQDGFNVEACRGHLASGREPDCMAMGCRARAACPVGIPYCDDQIRYHMKAFGKI